MSEKMQVKIDDDFARCVPGYRVVAAECRIVNGAVGDRQQSVAAELCRDIAGRYAVEDIKQLPAIAATRTAYKACGKDPNRYRPSQEQLMRRIVRGLGLYTVSAAVDAGNMLSLLSGCAVGCFDADKLAGDVAEVGIGRAGEPYCGIGRGELNIEGMPVVRDAEGAFGTPTSDNERTKLDDTTTRMFMTIHLFDSGIDADAVIDLAKHIFEDYCSATDFVATVVNA